MKIIYESKKPKFAITKDTYQWIICLKQKKHGEWQSFSYHPNLSNLLDELSEVYFKEFTHKLKDIKELQKSIDKVYGLNSRIAESFKKMRVKAATSILSPIRTQRARSIPSKPSKLKIIKEDIEIKKVKKVRG